MCFNDKYVGKAKSFRNDGTKKYFIVATVADGTKADFDDYEEGEDDFSQWPKYKPFERKKAHDSENEDTTAWGHL